MVRDWMEGDFKNLVVNVGRWFSDMEIVAIAGKRMAPDQKFETREIPLGVPEAKAPDGGVLGMPSTIEPTDADGRNDVKAIVVVEAHCREVEPTFAEAELVDVGYLGNCERCPCALTHRARERYVDERARG